MKKSTLNRMLELANIKPVIKESKLHLSNFELVKNSVNGKSYAIVKENKKYYIKEAQTKNTLSESDFDYVGGTMNKAKKSFNSFSDATKHLNLMFEEINNHHDVESTDLLESDVVLSEKRFVLKTKKPKAKKDDFEDFGFGDDEEESGDEGFDFESDDTEESDDEGFDFESDEETGEEDFDFESDEETGDDEIKDIQSTTGKLGQQLRDVEDISSDMMKWVAKSVLAALDLENMDSDDKQDVIRTIEDVKPEESTEETGEEDFDFESDEELEEAYDSTIDVDLEDSMADGDPFDGLDQYLSEYGEGEDNPVGNRDVRVADPDEVGDDMLLLDIDTMSPEELEALNPNSNRARKFADKDIRKHYHKPATPHSDRLGTDKWAKHSLPYDTEFNLDFIEEGDDIHEDHLNHEMNSYEQETTYEEVESYVRKFGMDVDLRMKVDDLVYLDVVENGNSLLVVKIDVMGNMEVGEMVGRRFIGEPLDSVRDFNDIFGDELSTTRRMELDMTENLSMAEPKTKPKQPTTKPGTPDRERPSKRPFNPPPKIDPNDPDALPGPKADYDDVFGNSPAPSKPAPTKDPDVKPGKDKPGRERPSKRPFSPPPKIDPNDPDALPGPKADYDDDVEFK